MSMIFSERLDIDQSPECIAEEIARVAEEFKAKPLKKLEDIKDDFEHRIRHNVGGKRDRWKNCLLGVQGAIDLKKEESLFSPKMRVKIAEHVAEHVAENNALLAGWKHIGAARSRAAEITDIREYLQKKTDAWLAKKEPDTTLATLNWASLPFLRSNHTLGSFT